MMDWTDRHCRYLHRQFSAHALLYTEMIVSAALVRGCRFLVYEGAPHGLMYTHMDRLNADILQFVREI